MESIVPGAFQTGPESTPEPTPTVPQEAPPDPYPGWSYPTRMCRICREDVVPTITMYPPGLPLKLQRPVVEYKNEDEYGRLIRPCKCRGGMRYIHELCLLRSRTEGVRPGSLWKCHECGHQFNFKRLTVQRWLGSKISSGLLTVLVMLTIMFFLGFVADPIINLYVDPYDTIVGNERYWNEVDVNDANDTISGWTLHFMKGLISMGLVGFLKTALFNPFNFLNLRGTGFVSSRRSGMSTTSRDRAVNVSWIAVAIGISSAFYFFYKWVQTLIGHTLQRIGNNIVDTSLPGDDDDLKPPPDWKPPASNEADDAWQAAERTTESREPIAPVDRDIEPEPTSSERRQPTEPPSYSSHTLAATSAQPLTSEPGSGGYSHHDQASTQGESPDTRQQDSLLVDEMDTGSSSALDVAREQEWSFVGIPRQR